MFPNQKYYKDWNQFMFETYEMKNSNMHMMHPIFSPSMASVRQPRRCTLSVALLARCSAHVSNAGRYIKCRLGGIEEWWHDGMMVWWYGGPPSAAATHRKPGKKIYTLHPSLAVRPVARPNDAARRTVCAAALQLGLIRY